MGYFHTFGGKVMMQHGWERAMNGMLYNLNQFSKTFMPKVSGGKGTNWGAVIKYWLVWLQPYFSQSAALPFNLSCMLMQQQQRRSQEETRLHVTWQRMCVWAHGPCGALSEATTQSTKGEFLLAKRMQSLQKFPVTSDPRRWWYSWEHDSNSLTWSMWEELQQPRSHRAALFAPLLNFNRWINCS